MLPPVSTIRDVLTDDVDAVAHFSHRNIPCSPRRAFGGQFTFGTGNEERGGIVARYFGWWKRSPMPGTQVLPAFLRTLLRGAPPDSLKQRCDRLHAEIEPRLRVVVAEAIGVKIEKLFHETSLQEDLAVDSLDLLDVLIRAEAEFGVVYPEGEIDAIRTYGDVVGLTTALVACRLRSEEVTRSRTRVEL